MIICNVLLSTFLTEENVFLMMTESPAYNFTSLMLGGIFQRITSISNHCKPCFSLLATYFQC